MVNQVISLPIVAMIVYIVHAGGDFFFLYLWAFCFVVLMFLMTIYPEFIAPLFDKYTPLPEGELRDMIEALAAKLHFPLKKLYVVEGERTKRTSDNEQAVHVCFVNEESKWDIINTLSYLIIAYSVLTLIYTYSAVFLLFFVVLFVLFLSILSEFQYFRGIISVFSGSKRSAHSNAYFYGFFNNKRIVLFDTLLQDWESKTSESEADKKEADAAAVPEKEADSGDGTESNKDSSDKKEAAVKKGCSNLEVVAVLSHELGHWSMNHVFKNIVLIQVPAAERSENTWGSRVPHL